MAETSQLSSPSRVISSLWGIPLEPRLATWLDELGAGAKPSRGDFHAFDAGDWLPSGNAFDFMLREWFRRAAMLSGMVPVGTSGSGDIWFVEAAPAPSARVFLLDHDLSELAIVADSIEAFRLFCELDERDEARAEAWASLAGHVRRTKDMPVPVAMLDADAETAARHASVDELLGCLWFRHLPKPRASDAMAATDAPGLLERLLRAYLREEDATLDPLLEVASTHRAGIARAAAASLGAKRTLRGFDQRYEALGTR